MPKQLVPKPFLTAHWRDLALITYTLDAKFVAPFLPVGCEPDLIDGRARCSLVAFDFTEARVAGVAWPFHVNFPEVNLRFYVTRGGERGVSFLREFVPRRAISVIARAIYNEPYSAVPMRSSRAAVGAAIRVEHTLRVQRRWQRITVTATGPAVLPVAGDAAEWLKEHSWGFGQTRGGRALSYEVVHPRWAVYPNAAAELDFDFAHVYGPQWAFLNGAQPVSTLLAEGSDVSVWPRRLTGENL